VGSEPWARDSWHWAVDSGQWTVNSGQGTVFRILQIIVLVKILQNPMTKILLKLHIS
jgi:hypothetical protein